MSDRHCFAKEMDVLNQLSWRSDIEESAVGVTIDACLQIGTDDEREAGGYCTGVCCLNYFQSRLRFEHFTATVVGGRSRIFKFA